MNDPIAEIEKGWERSAHTELLLLARMTMEAAMGEKDEAALTAAAARLAIVETFDIEAQPLLVLTGQLRGLTCAPTPAEPTL